MHDNQAMHQRQDGGRNGFGVGASRYLAGRFKVTVSDDVSQPVAVRPDGIVASTELVRELFGFDLIPGPVRSQSAVELAPTFPHHQSQRSELQVRSTINTA